MLWLMCLGLSLVFKGGAIRVEEDCLVQDQLLIKIPNPGPASFFAYVQHNGFIFTAKLMCTASLQLIFLNVTSRDVVWEDRLAKSKKQERTKSPTSKEGWTRFVVQAGTLQLSDAEGRFWTTRQKSRKCNSFNIRVSNGVLAKQLCGGAAKWLVTKDHCAYVHLPPASNNTLSVNFLSNQSFVPVLTSENFTAKLVRRNGEVVLVKDETCSGCQPLDGEHNVLRFPLSASSQFTNSSSNATQMAGKASPRAVTVCSSSGGSFVVNVRETQEATSDENAYIMITIAVVMILTLLPITAY
ncbi:uncharacterized protein LOC119586217 isoform X2 [Penaeus monodon]|uniref:uncharacterized protein LOC119586217 isoform X2 n=1 Tax=Penaeus monodon TaxID=6687 RepID=UPI0018A7B415|nr:uncharacterized protein LOC119586217 isoform X2 [Penaeus monodon]